MAPGSGAADICDTGYASKLDDPFQGVRSRKSIAQGFDIGKAVSREACAGFRTNQLEEGSGETDIDGCYFRAGDWCWSVARPAYDYIRYEHMNPQFAADIVASVSTGSGPFTFASVTLKRQDQDPGLVDIMNAKFVRFTIPTAVQPFLFAYLDAPSPGSCLVYGHVNGLTGTPIHIVGGLDAGPQVTVQGPNGTESVPGSGGTYKGTISANGSYLSAGNYTVSAPGGADVGKFSVPVTIPTMPTMTYPTPDAASPTAVTRADGLTVTWTGGQANELIQIEGFNATDNTYTAGADFQCLVAGAAGTFTVPPSVLLAMPAGNFGGLTFTSNVMPVSISGTGLTVAFLDVSFTSFAPLNYK